MTTDQISVIPLFLGDEGEKVFVVHFIPKKPVLGHIIYLPPFGEEMNRCRSLAAEQARNFARAGYSCMIMDFFGTGESQGELYDATMGIWHRQIDQVAEFLCSKNDVPITLWGCRLGALLALEHSSRAPERYKKLLFWQPVSAGKSFMTQLLRLRVAWLAARGLPPETTKEIREKMRQGEVFEISGYPIGGKLIEEIESRSMAIMSDSCSASIEWLENVSDAEASISVAAQKAVDSLTQAGATVSLHKFVAPPVWQLPKREFAPSLIEITSGLPL